jgi:hypothetical protein
MSVSRPGFDPAAFPFPIVTVEGERALQERDRLSATGVAIIIGNDEQAARVAENLGYRDRTAADIVEAASTLAFPKDWLAELARREVQAGDWLAAHPEALNVTGSFLAEDGRWRPETPEERAAMDERAAQGPDVGDWPTDAEPMGFSSAMGLEGSEPWLHITILPTHDATEAPAYLGFGGWNECPPPEYHIAALRHWRDAFGASLVTCGADVMELKVSRRPSRDAAMSLAKEHYAYCNDIIDQGLGTFSNLAAALTVSDWWYFWWD